LKALWVRLSLARTSFRFDKTRKSTGANYENSGAGEGNRHYLGGALFYQLSQHGAGVHCPSAGTTASPQWRLGFPQNRDFSFREETKFRRNFVSGEISFSKTFVSFRFDKISPKYYDFNKYAIYFNGG
jgi:hypothetical protein